ncbi:MAG: hypothetical protein A2X99_02575 [Deltaproteobacteria bacterium GWB2_55_19]|nr:MAG: hypothetical protein A2X99_02575 [Deltaproteobacteria bacterium GWB2_55_19]HAO94270.1 cytochrome C [Deltaproteobacteria bacterium]
MKKIFVGGMALGAALLFGGASFAADGAAVYKARCAMCHGADGQGTAMAPAFKASDYMKTAKDAEIADAITNGREGAAKKYKQFASGMPKQTLSEDDVKAMIEYLKTLAAK